MCREDDDRTFRDLVNRFDCDCALGLKIGDNMRVVDNFVLYVDGSSVALERDLDYVYGADDSSTKASWGCQKYLQITLSLDWTIYCGSSEEVAQTARISVELARLVVGGRNYTYEWSNCASSNPRPLSPHRDRFEPLKGDGCTGRHNHRIGHYAMLVKSTARSLV